MVIWRHVLGNNIGAKAPMWLGRTSGLLLFVVGSSRDEVGLLIRNEQTVAVIRMFGL